MPFKPADVQNEYAKNKKLREDDVKALQQWIEKQPHLPPATELQLILFLQSCYFSVERAKAALDSFFTVRALCPEFFANRDPNLPSSKEFMNVGLYTPLPKLTPEGYRVIYCRIVDCDPSKYVFTDQLKSFDMNQMLCLMREGTAEGLLILSDMGGISFGHMARLSIMGMKKFLYYLQEAMPVRLLGLHFINVVPFMDKILAMMRPFMKKELMDVLHLHAESIESLYKFVPKECLPTDFGGTAGSIAELHDAMKKTLLENADYFKAEEQQVADESKRPGKPKNAGEIFGVEGTFKKLDID